MIRYYKDFSDDFVTTKNQAKKVPENYRFIKRNPFYRILGFILFQILKLVGFFYAKFALHLKIVDKGKIKPGSYIFANHTLELGDVFNPTLYSPVHPYYVCDSSNLGIPILGKILPLVGALPIPDSIHGKKQLFSAIQTRIKQGKTMVIYPEAHLWPYYTKIRPLEAAAFHFPVRDNTPVFTATTVFNKPKRGKKPKITIYIDGPFSPDETLDKYARLQKLHDQVEAQLKSRTEISDYEYITYKRKAA